VPQFIGGPLDGQLGYAEGIDPPASELAASAAGEEEDLPPNEKFDTALRFFRELASSDGDFTEEDKLLLEQITTLAQKLKAKGEKDSMTALNGKMSPAVGKAYG